MDPGYRMSASHLASSIAADRDAGLRPFLVVANAGATNTGAIDPLEELAEICTSESIRLHADGAYGGLFALTDRGRSALGGIDRADSITVDPHGSASTASAPHAATSRSRLSGYSARWRSSGLPSVAGVIVRWVPYPRWEAFS